MLSFLFNSYYQFLLNWYTLFGPLIKERDLEWGWRFSDDIMFVVGLTIFTVSNTSLFEMWRLKQTNTIVIVHRVVYGIAIRLQHSFHLTRKRPRSMKSSSILVKQPDTDWAWNTLTLKLPNKSNLRFYSVLYIHPCRPWKIIKSCITETLCSWRLQKHQRSMLRHCKKDQIIRDTCLKVFFNLVYIQRWLLVPFD